MLIYFEKNQFQSDVHKNKNVAEKQITSLEELIHFFDQYLLPIIKRIYVRMDTYAV